MSTDRETVALCIRCRKEFTEEDIAGAHCCPNCGSRSVPADPRKKHTLTFTDHEWRILFMWAHNWAVRCDTDAATGSVDCMDALKREARRQAPTLPAISLREESQDVATAFGTKVELIEGASTETILPERKH